ncbi:SecDF P1 head subdomain-containing protein [Winogradskyella sp.]|uniref:SecDF P1 head subdomain-containing protein n=1 Tax=Winogradskyella sp. TaxID=1883156 RepID=UPI003BADA59B
MKKLCILLIISLLFSCANLSDSEQYEITYAFVNLENIAKADKAKTMDVLKKRLSKYHKNVEVERNSDNEIIVRLPAGFDIDVVNQIVENQGKLDFWPCIAKDQMLRFVLKMDSITKNDTIPKSFSSMVLSLNPAGFPIFAEEDLPHLKKLVKGDKVKSLFVGDYRRLKLLFGRPDDGYVELYGVESNQTERAPINESHIIEAQQDYDQIGRPAVSITMNEYGAHKWYQMTNDAYENDTKIAVTLNDQVYSAPGVTSGPISGGLTQISGGFTLNQAIDLSNVLRSQQMIPKLKFVRINKLDKQ